MNTELLYEILQETTSQLRKGEEVETSTVGDVQRVDIFAMPHEDEVTDNGIVKVDCHFLTIGVDKQMAEAHRDQLVEILNDWPSEAWGQPVPPLQQGPSYIHVGGVIGDQGAAFQLFALGSVLGFWEIITPALLGITGPEADQIAGGGMIMISGYNPEASQAAATSDAT